MADIRITGRMVNAIRITLDTNDHDAIRQQLSKTLQNASTAGALVVLESSVEQDWMYSRWQYKKEFWLNKPVPFNSL